MNKPVADSAVDEYVAKIRAGLPAGNIFPGKMSECDFTPAQREKIRQARKDQQVLRKKIGSAKSALPANPNSTTPAPPAPKTQPTMRKLEKMLFLQGGACFFCGMPLLAKDASIEHLQPKSRGGANTEDNEVVCHRTLNQALGDMDLKRKFELVLKTKGTFRCPGT